VDRKERNRLNGGTAIANAQQRQPDYRKETKNESGDCQMDMRRRRIRGSAQEQQRNADYCDRCTRGTELLHLSMISDGDERRLGGFRYVTGWLRDYSRVVASR
jgi:hypothetical protein